MITSSIKFLLVDDLEENLLATEALLRKEGLQLLQARSAAEALELLLIHDFSLALIDVQMPEMDGFALAELMRGTERTRHVPIIFLTAGLQDSRRRFRGYELGAVDFLYKPVDPHILQSKSDVFFQLALQKQELRRQAEVLENTVAERTAKLRESLSELEHFSYTITHDMRAPLRAMQSFGDLLVDEYAPKLDAVGQNYIRRIIAAAHRMDRLIVDALNYSKAVQAELNLDVVDTGPLLRSIVESYPQFQNPQANIQIVGDLPKVRANEAGLTQCFSNLLSNAVKFVESNNTPEVKIWSECANGAVRFWVHDNGIGIPADQKERIFVMFQRLDKRYEGTGVGLALVRKVIQRMRGSVGFESEPGKGTKFWIELPIAA